MIIYNIIIPINHGRYPVTWGGRTWSRDTLPSSQYQGIIFDYRDKIQFDL